MSERDRKIVGSPLNFRGLVYGPINEQGVVYLFGLVAEDLNIRVEGIQQGYPDCTAVRHVGRGRWERIDIEFEYKSSNFDHDPDKCDVLVCWEDDLPEGKRDIIKGLQVYELKAMINTADVPNKPLKDPEERPKTHEEDIYDLEYHFKRKKVTKVIQELFAEVDANIRKMDDSIWVKYPKTAITYYSPERVFVYLRMRKNSLFLTIYTGQKTIPGVKNIKDHENWGTLHIDKQKELPQSLEAIKQSFELIKEAIQNSENTGWYALTPREKISANIDDDIE